MPKGLSKKQLLSARISKLEEELKNLPDDMFLDDDYFPDRNLSEDFDADFFDIERELESNKKLKDVKSQKLDAKLAREYKPQFQPRGRGSRSRILIGRARGRGRISMYRGNFRPTFKPQKSYDLYNDEEDWSRYVPKSRDTEGKSFREGQPSSSKNEVRYEKDSPSSSKDQIPLSSESLIPVKDSKTSQEDKDMFYFPNEKPEPKSNVSNKEQSPLPTTRVLHSDEKSDDPAPNKTSDVMSLFEELQAQLSSSAANIPGFDILADTLKKLEKLKEDKNEDKRDTEGPNETASEGIEKNTKGTDLVRDKFGFVIKPAARLNSKDGKFKEFDSKKKRIEEKFESTPRESSPLRKIAYSGSPDKESSPIRKRDPSPYRRKESTNRKRDSSSPSRRRVSPPTRKRGRTPPSPHRRRPSPNRRRGGLMPPYRHKRNLHSPLRGRRRDSGSPGRRRDSGEFDPRKHREHDWYPRRSPKRLRSRSKSYSPRRDHRQRSSSRSPRRWHGHEKKRERSLSLSPGPDSIKSRDRELDWYKSQVPGMQSEQLMQPQPPGGESSDVCAEPNFNAPPGGNNLPVFDPAAPIHDRLAWEYDNRGGQYYPPYQPPPSNLGSLPSNVAGPPPNMSIPPPIPMNMAGPLPRHAMHLERAPHMVGGPPSSMMQPSVIPLLGGPPEPLIDPGSRVSNAEYMENTDSNDHWTHQGQDNIYKEHSNPYSYVKPLPAQPNIDEEEAKRKAVEKEMKQQKRTLKKQRKDYEKRQNSLRWDLEQLIKQKRELVAEKRADNEAVISKNSKLQLETQNKLKAVANVIDMLSGIIGQDDSDDDDDDEEEEKKEPTPPPQPAPAPPKKPAPEKVINLDSPPSEKVVEAPPVDQESASSQVPSWWLKPMQQTPREKISTPDKNSLVTPTDREKMTIPLIGPAESFTPPRKPQIDHDLPIPKGKHIRGTTPTKDVTPPLKVVMTPPRLVTSSPPRVVTPPPPRVVTPPPPRVLTPPPTRMATPPPPRVVTPPPPYMSQLPSAFQPAVPSTSKPEEEQKFNIVHFDPEMHWCRVCNVFPRTAKEFLNHLHAPDHKQNLSDRKLVDLPWHAKQTIDEIPTYKDAPTKRVPIKVHTTEEAKHISFEEEEMFS